MGDTVISVENVSKQYRLGAIGSGTLRQDLNRAWARLRGQPDPLSTIGEEDFGEYGDGYIWALRDVSFEVKEGEVLGIIGRNGAGKSTLLKILSRVTAPTSGQIKVKGRIASLLEVGTGFHPDLTGRENVFLNGAILGMSRAEIQHKFDEIVAFAEIEKFIDTPVKRYSSGMYVRLAFAVAAHLEPEILIVDEVLAVGDAAFQKKCLGKMGDVAREGRTVLFVSHNMVAVEHLCSQGIVLRTGKVALSGSIGDAVTHYEGMLLSDSSRMNKLLPSNVIYEKPESEPKLDFEVVRIELLDSGGAPKTKISTWDRFIFRIHYFACRPVNSGSLELFISSRHGDTLLRLSTQPDSTVPMSIQPGYHYGDCELAELPLSAGDFVVGAGLAIPNKEWLWRADSLATFTVHPRDVYQSGLAPATSRSLLAIPHKWKV